MSVADIVGQPSDCERPDAVEVVGGVSETEVLRPAAQEAVDLGYDLFGWRGKPRPCRQEAHPVSGVLHGLA